MELTVDINAIFRQAKEVLAAPRNFFAKAKKEKDWKKAFVFVLVAAAVGHVLTAVYNIFIYPLLAPSISEVIGVPASGFDAGQVVVAAIISYILTLGMSFIWGAALKVWLMLFRVNSDFSSAYRVMAYSRTPNYLFSWLPVVNIAAALYSFYLLMLGLETQYSMSRKKTILVLVSSIVAVALLSLLVVSFLPTF
jgi:hypothetical protein